MTIPPFPSQDLAKLVLGYLAEEQLMTAYDEFLQASPYLDALRNEYDRIFMTSLKNILAEYRAVKIYVETCKPFALRKRLFQCANLFEIVKLLVQNVDMNKLNAQEHNVDKMSSNPSLPCNQSISQIEATSLESSVETTALADLPGNTMTKKKSAKVLDREHRNPVSSQETCNEVRQPCSIELSSLNSVPQSVANEGGQNDIEQGTNNILEEDMTKSKKFESVQKIEEFDNILDFVCKNGNENNNRTFPTTDTVSDPHQRISTAGTFRDFTTGIYNDNKSNISTSTSPDVNNAQAPLRRSIGNAFVNIGTINRTDLKSKGHLILNLGSVKNNQGLPVITSEARLPMENSLTTQNTGSIKHEENKIKILSDVKVEKSYDNIYVRPKPPLVFNNATSTPHVQMQTIFINGTQAYKHKTQNPLNCNYTKDEIMAMPTIILVPATGSKSSATDSQPIVTMPTKNDVVTATTSCGQSIFKPLVVDVTSNITVPNITCDINEKFKNSDQKLLNEQSLIKTVDVAGHVSVPKENTFSTALKTSTPQGLPPKRKSSSTPRRSSHVRVLDFTTPRRILHETINEQSSNKNISGETEPSESSDPPCKESVEIGTNNAITEKVSNNANVPCTNLNSDAAKENKVILNKKNNWDADLRALIVKDIDNSNNSFQKTKNKTKGVISAKKKKSDDKNAYKTEENVKSEKKSKKSLSKVKGKSIKKSVDSIDEIEDVSCNNKETSSVAVKPTINIITTTEWNTNQENDKSQNKNNTSHERIDTPESERIALQSVIGAKLNISHLLETPYKQALYDIQMDTPKYLGPDLPDEPISDVKIMSIPTPRFLCSPKGAQATPSTYSSRPTDYSSGGSYYKPDDQDYIIPTEILDCPITSGENVKTSERIEKSCKKMEVNNKNDELKQRRPVRQCRKNVSYYKNPNNSKIKESEENLEHSDSVSVNISVDKADNAINQKKSKDTKRKSNINKKNISLKKLKSPLKREIPKTFMKIKPRRTTPIKESIGGKSRKTSDSFHHKAQKRTNSKESSSTPLATNVPTKSRRKSSTPRKLHCTKTFNSQHSDHISPESIKSKQSISQESQICSHDSDIEQLPLRWSDDGSQDGKSQDTKLKQAEAANDTDDICKIKEYIETSVAEQPVSTNDGEGSLHIDLIKRGFDVETAKIIERDLLDSPCPKREIISDVVDSGNFEFTTNDPVEENSARTASETSVNLEIVDDDNCDEVEFSTHECNEETENFFSHEYVDLSYTKKSLPPSLKDNYTMEFCVEDDVTVRLRATTFNMLLDQDFEEMDAGYICKETEIAVSSISNIDKLYTPMKDPKAQVYEIFDSTLTSLDTPLKVATPTSQELEPIVTEIELEVEKVDNKEKVDMKKRKRLQSSYTSDESPNCSKRPKSETQYLLNTANIHNIDIESVLSKLHGP